ncbi:helicase-exonuclease AddAB subunit AddA [uncultured Selenomonas sp.]|uniref:helicase-exonuclease AddAB subunit AddA n=1 Tax=uncultured Selenomonas sp. TaxID=159275 RepID=UPI0028D3074C|nr:helicase-exonuclease AddAB subunit AddA [uncultured Selenomonas sp.]
MAERMQFTADQQKAIETRGQNILVAAAAGSGKTRVLVERIISQVRAGTLSLDRVLVLTFTKAAASEMRERIEAALNTEIDAIVETGGALEEVAALERQRVLLTGTDISTFHSFCQRLIQSHIDATEIPPTFRIASEQEIRLLKNDVFEQMIESEYEKAAADDPEGFLSFSDAHGGVKGDDEKLQGEILALHAFSLSQPSPVTWLAAQGNEPTDTPYWARNGFQTLADELEHSLSQVCTNYTAAIELLKSGGNDLRTAAGKCLDALAHNKGIYEDLKADLNGFVNAKQDSAWKAFLAQAAAAKKAKKNIPRKAVEDCDPEVGSQLKKLTEKIHAPWDGCITRLPTTAQELCDTENAANAAIRQYVRLTTAFHNAFQQKKIERSILDFSDLEHTALELLCRDPKQLQEDPSIAAPTEIADELRAHYDAIMVDEYQDTNGLQEGILRQIARENNRFIVGDVKQSIYRFRLADPSLFQHTYEAYRGDSTEGELVTMSENFRSRAEVLEPINEIFSQIMSKEAVDISYDVHARLNPGRVFAEPTKGTSLAGPLEINLLRADYSADAEEEERKAFEIEAYFIARRIQELKSEGYVLHNGDTVQNKDIVILLRGAKERAGILLDALRKENISAYADDTAGYFEASEIRMMLSLLAVLDNARQDTPLAAVLVSPMIGMTMEDMAALRIHTPLGGIYDILTGATGKRLPDNLTAKAANALERIRHWRRCALVQSVPELLRLLYRETGYYDYVGGLPGGILRQANLRMLIDRAADFERTNERGLFRFLRYIDTLKRRSTDLSVARTLGESEDVVRIMTIHRSKGLEFPIVFLANISGAFNTQDTRDDLLYHVHEGIGLRVYENSMTGRQKYDTMSRRKIKAIIQRETMAEEMRILYVAMTRAQEKLILTGTLNITRTGKDALEQLRENCLKYAQTEDTAFPKEAVLGAKCYLDWIALALMRHPDGAVLFGDADEIAHRPPTNEKARFDLHLPHENVRVPQNLSEEREDNVLSAVRADEPLSAGKDADRVAAVLDWVYDLRGTAQIHAKTSVTELKRQQADEEESIAPVLPAVADSVDTPKEWEVPRFLRLSEQEHLTPMERGTAMHTVMQQLDLSDIANISAIECQLEQLVEKGILTEAERGIINVGNIWTFVSSKLGRRMRAAKAVYRELPFGRLLPAHTYYKEATDEDDQIFLQGIIDVLFEEENGDYILLDYKTDRKISAATARARYQFQIDLYCDAVETILGKEVKERYLFLLDTGREVRL